MASKINNKLYPTLYPNFEVLNNYNNIIMASKADFNLSVPEQKPLITEAVYFTACGPKVITVADIETALTTAGCVSPNDPANPIEVVGLIYENHSKGRDVIDNSNADAEVVATGETVLITDSKGQGSKLMGGDSDDMKVCVVDANCDLIPDKEVSDLIAFDIPADTCVKYGVTYA